MHAAPYFSKYQEEQWLDFFWQSVHAHVDRADVLRKLAGVQLATPGRSERLAIRFAFRGVAVWRHRGDQCFCCFHMDRRLAWHHIIQVQHGGSNSARNMVPLCQWCHQRVHPWLEIRPEKRRTTWASIQEIVVDFFKKLQPDKEPAPVRVEPPDEQPF